MGRADGAACVVVGGVVCCFFFGLVVGGRVFVVVGVSVVMMGCADAAGASLALGWTAAFFRGGRGVLVGVECVDWAEGDFGL